MSDYFFHCFIAPGAAPCCFCLEKHCRSIHALGCSVLPVSLLANCDPKSTLPGSFTNQALPRGISGCLLSEGRVCQMLELHLTVWVHQFHPKLTRLPVHPLFLPLCERLKPKGHGRGNQRVWRRLETFPCRQEAHSLVRV